ncbi:MAG: hypothetical protein ABFQ65_01330 [Nanoarchaeota archaeon]
MTEKKENEKESQEVNKDLEKSSEEIIEGEESGLEEEIEEAETNIDTNKFQDFMININSKSPSLERVAIVPESLTSLETELAEAPVVKEDKDGIKYSAINYDEKKEKSYQENAKVNEENLIVNSSLTFARQNLRETIQTDTKQDFQFNPELQRMKKVQDDYSVKSPIEDFKETKTQDPFQKIKKEYEFR